MRKAIVIATVAALAAACGTPPVFATMSRTELSVEVCVRPFQQVTGTTAADADCHDYGRVAKLVRAIDPCVFSGGWSGTVMQFNCEKG